MKCIRHHFQVHTLLRLLMYVYNANYMDIYARVFVLHGWYQTYILINQFQESEYLIAMHTILYFI